MHAQKLSPNLDMAMKNQWSNSDPLATTPDVVLAPTWQKQLYDESVNVLGQNGKHNFTIECTRWSKN